MIVPYADIRLAAQAVERVVVFAPYMDSICPGRGMADVLPESIRAAGASGVVLNHSERRMTLSEVNRAVHRANDLELLTFICAETVQMGKALAHFHPDIINPEPVELIGTGKTTDKLFVQTAMKAIHEVDPDILVEHAAGISKPEQVFDFICAGAQGIGVASGICTAADPCIAAKEMIAAVRSAINYRD